MQPTSSSRREFLKLSATGLTACAIGGSLNAFAVEEKKKIPVAVQLYPVRNECAKDLEGTLAAIGKMGYSAVEFADYHGRTAKQLRTLLDNNGLKCCGTHIYMETMMGDELAKTIEFSQTLGNRLLVIRSFSQKYLGSRDGLLKAADIANGIAEKLKPVGMRVGHHTHGADFKPVDGEFPEDIFLGHTQKEVFLQLDTGNVADVGIDPVVYLKKYAGRVAGLHVKPFSKAKPNAILGDDELPWPEIFNLAETIGGTEWYILEYERDAYSPMVALEKNIEVMRKWGKC